MLIKDTHVFGGTDFTQGDSRVPKAEFWPVTPAC